MKKNYLKPEFFNTLKGYSKNQFVNDIIAGIIVAIIALPLSIALALASGVEPATGVYTAIFAGFTVSLLGGSRVQIAGPTAAFATIVASIVATHGMDGLILATIIAGILLILMGVLKLGSLIKFVPNTITTGFTAGIAVTIFIGQIKDFLGLQYEKGVSPIEAIEKIEANIHAIGTFSWQALVIGLVSLLILIFYPKIEKKIPPSLIAVIVGALMVKFIPVFSNGVKTIGSLYTIPSGLPPFSLGTMDFSMDKITAILPSAFTIMILVAIESLLSCVVADGMINQKHNSNAELVAQGIGNIASVLFGGIPATGAIARTAANIKNGGKTPVAGMVHSLVLLLVLLFLMPMAALIPMPTIAAILFVVAYNMSGWKKVVGMIKKAPKSDIAIMLVTFILTVVFDLVVAIEVGMIMAVVFFMKRMSDEMGVSQWSETGGNKILPKGVKVYEINGPLFFGATDKLSIITPDNATTVIIRMGSVPAIDATALSGLEAILEKCKESNTRLILSHVNAQPLKALKRSNLYDMIGGENICKNIDEALLKA